MDASIRPILSEVERATERGARISIWWRDDDAIRATPQLDRLLALSARAGLPLGIAAIPDRVEASLIERLHGERHVRVLPHGFRHDDHAGPDAKAAEFGADRPLATMMDEARRARAAISDAFGDLALDVFVPPWNRIAPALEDALPRLGYLGLSTFARGQERHPHRIDTHLDPVDWHGTRSLRPSADIAADLRVTLDGGAATIGILTHHLAFDEPLWRFSEALLTALAAHPAVQVRSIEDLVDAPPRRHPAHPAKARDLARGLAG